MRERHSRRGASVYDQYDRKIARAKEKLKGDTPFRSEACDDIARLSCLSWVTGPPEREVRQILAVAVGSTEILAVGSMGAVRENTSCRFCSASRWSA